MIATGPGLHVLITQAACALAEALFPARSESGEVMVPLRQAHVFAAGRVDAWTQWRDQPRVVHELVGQLLRLRHNDLGSLNRFLRAARDAAQRNDSPYALAPNTSAKDAEFVLPRHGQDPLDLAVGLLNEAQAKSSQNRIAAPLASHGLWTFGSQDRTVVRLPQLDGGELPALQAQTVADLEDLTIAMTDLLTIADELDAAQAVPPWRSALIRKLFHGLKDTSDRNVERLELRNGRLTTLNAPTGVGKTVLIQLTALLLARRGVPVAIVVGNIKDALKLTEDLTEQARAAAASKQEIRCAPLIAARRVYEHAIDAARTEHWDRFDRLAYACTMSSWRVDGPNPQSGEEPCTRLYPDKSTNDRGPAKRHLCPLIASCDRFRSVREAANADLIITNHHNLMHGNIAIPIIADGTRYGRMSVMEFVMRRCPVILIDEVDQLQSGMFDMDARQLVLADNTTTSNSQPLAQLDQQRSRLPPTQDREIAPSLFRTRYLADQLLNYVLDGELQLDSSLRRSTQDEGDSSGWHIPGSNDHWLIEHLLGEVPSDRGYSEQVYKRFNALFPDSERDSEPLPAGPLQLIAEHLRDLVGENTGFDRLREVKRALISPVLQITMRSTERASDGASLQREIVNALLVRTWLGALHQSLTALTFALGAHNVELAGSEALQRQLGDFVQHATIPFGPLGYLLFGLKIDREGRDHVRGRLSAQVIAGDPHNNVRQLADVVALAAVGAHRIVLGLSATSFFPGASREHVLTEPSYTMTDAARGTFKAAAGTALLEGRAIHVAGQKEHKKPDVIRDLGRNLWHQQLDAHLRALAATDPDRERCLLVANSYKQAALLAGGIVEGCAQPSWVAVVVHQDPRMRTALVPSGAVTVTLDQLESLAANHPSVKICVAPIDRVSRGLNILIPGTTRSALSSIWVCVRPVLQLNAPAEILASMNAYALTTGSERTGADPAHVLSSQRRAARRRLHALLAADPRFTRLPRELKAEAIAGMIVKLIQLGGRARRGGTEMAMFLVDNAFLNSTMGSDLRSLLRDYHDSLTEADRVSLGRTYGSTLESLLQFAGVALRAEKEQG